MTRLAAVDNIIIVQKGTESGDNPNTWISDHETNNSTWKVTEIPSVIIVSQL